MLLPASYYQRKNVVAIARDLIGKTLVTRINNKITAGIITETEAYAGVIDKAAHSYGGRRTKRTETMYSEGGVSYVYLCYGIHHLFNIVTNSKDVPEAVLIRAIHPTRGIPEILKRRNAKSLTKNLCVGPGKVSAALGIRTNHDNISLMGKTIWLEDEGIKINPKKIHVGPRIGIDYAGEDALLPYRFWIDNIEWKM
ncbi:MAG: 3-methyladenine glycosylase [Bacteroidetes bacterium]|jgi:DNA-3-methyladenine glycosylase|nr:3-methyladenine glycosylase [Bacteroidota bacterium]